MTILKPAKCLIIYKIIKDFHQVKHKEKKTVTFIHGLFSFIILKRRPNQ